MAANRGASAVELERLVKDDGRALILFSHGREERDVRGDSDVLGEGDVRRASHVPGVSDKAAGSASEHASIGLRFNELRGEEVDYAIHRQDRTFLPPRDHCPLDPTLPGREPTEIPVAAFEIAVFDNRFPAFQAPLGAAEVVVYTDDHEASITTLPLERLEDLMWVWRQRYEELGARGDIHYVYIFENRGVEVGVTLHHAHGQIYGYPFVPPVPALELAADERLGGCAVCMLVGQELADGRRLLFENDAVVVYVPYAARWAYEAHVVLREHRASLLECEPAELQGLAAALQTLTRGYDALFDKRFPYVMAVHQAPTGGELRRGHLHVEFYPPLRTAEKLKYLAGSEQGAGSFISDTLPEDSAAALREAIARAA
jgi:UDPglucose--hexose-1-phosphate uridylyltransferase